ncbi:hypothetical protein ACWEKR_10050 [Nocardia sp. NPDC004573]
MAGVPPQYGSWSAIHGLFRWQRDGMGLVISRLLQVFAEAAGAIRSRASVDCFNQFEQHRAVATRHDKLAVRYLATIPVAAINQWLRTKCERATRPTHLTSTQNPVVPCTSTRDRAIQDRAI